VLVAAALTACHGNPKPAVTPTPAPRSTEPAVRQLQRDLDERLAAAELGAGTWGLTVRSLETGDVLYSRNSRKLLMPASNMKTVTLAAAAERLGWDFSFETQLVADGSVDEGFLNGDLIVVGHGDPSIDNWDGDAGRLFAAWAERLKASGIRIVLGRVIGNDNAFDDALPGSGWAWDDLDRSFAAGVGALQFNQNTAQVTIGPGHAESDPALAGLSPDGAGLVLRNLLKTSASGAPASIQSRRLAGSALLELRGAVPLGSDPFVRNVSVYNPTQYFVSALRAGLIANGIEIRGPALDIDDGDSLPDGAAGATLITHRSPPLRVLAGTMMKLSQNLYAETILQALGGVVEVRTVLESWGIPAEDLLIADGSGLSRYNLITADALAAILTHVAESDRLREPFEATLPIAGRDGTLELRMRGTAAEGNVRAKTGSFSNARSLAGYVQTADGEPLVFAIIANNFGIPASTIEQVIDSVAVTLAQFSR
jgi:D-alanyl-D-alanine carboxypeptidase/D-alanyl-D-alanine-endopeptidase (penicillin-binding protein 4)